MAVGELFLEFAGETERERLAGFGKGNLKGCWGKSVRRGLMYRCWTLWKPGRRGTGTKMTIAFLP